MLGAHDEVLKRLHVGGTLGESLKEVFIRVLKLAQMHLSDGHAVEEQRSLVVLVGKLLKDVESLLYLLSSKRSVNPCRCELSQSRVVLHARHETERLLCDIHTRHAQVHLNLHRDNLKRGCRVQDLGCLFQLPKIEVYYASNQLKCRVVESLRVRQPLQQSHQHDVLRVRLREVRRQQLHCLQSCRSIVPDFRLNNLMLTQRDV
mmetsp:Transcript_9346/g.31258  ORF Transcript_9346/g.31258 Transcript_9346/m.31258 type:complete len:204 (-) Transcript_9346:137-748(-)